MQKKIRNHTTAKVPFQLLAGEKDVSAGAVSFRFRDGTQVNGVPGGRGRGGRRSLDRRTGATTSPTAAAFEHLRPAGGGVDGDAGAAADPAPMADPGWPGRGRPGGPRGWGRGRPRRAGRRRRARPSRPAVDPAPDGVRERRRPVRRRRRPRVPVLPDPDAVRRGRADRGPGHDRVRRVEPVPVQPGASDGGAVPAHRRLHRPGPRRVGRVQRVHPHAMGTSSGRSAPRTGSTSASTPAGRRRRHRPPPAPAPGAPVGRRCQLHAGDRQTKVLPQLLADTRGLLAAAW